MKSANGPARLFSRFASVLFLLGLVACQSTSGPGGLEITTSQRALPVMERITLSASDCWFKKGDGRFDAYRIAPELSSHIGRPRLLLVPAARPQDRPLAVIEAEGEPATVRAYGPLLSTPLGNRIATDIRNWTAGGTGCTA